MLNNTKFAKSFYFILFCIRSLSGNNVKKSLFYCVSAIFLSKIALVIQPIFLGNIVDTLAISHANENKDLILLSLFCFIGFLSVFLLSIRNYFILVFRENIGKDISSALLKKLQQFSHSFFYNRNAVELAEINNVGQEAIHGFLVSFLSDIVPFFFELSLIFIIIVAKINVMMAVPLLAVFITYFSISIVFSSKERKSNSEIREIKTKSVSQFYENIINFDSIKLMSAEKCRLNLFSQAADQVLLQAKKHGKLFFNKALFQNFVLYFGLFFTLTLSMIGVLHKQISPGDFIIINTYFFQIVLPLTNVLRSYEIFNKSITDIESLMQLMQRNPDLEIIEPKITLTHPEINIKFLNVNFGYRQEFYLSNINFNIPFRHKIALVDSTGGGKSTLAKLLMRFYDPDSGNITINDHNIKHISFSHLRHLIGYVPQEITLFHDTLLNNLLVGLEGMNIHDVQKMTKDTGILDFVDELVGRFDTIVGDRGLKLSGGQRQRIGIARMLLRKPKLLILDEYNSALDITTEQHLNHHLNPSILGCSILIIAHRLSAVVDADEILVIKNGSIIQRGQHTTLIQEKGWYQAAWNTFSKHHSSIENAIII